MNTKILENLWLNKNEISIYLFLLNNWNANISEISKYTGINRPAIYSTIPNMIESWLLIEILKWKRKHYSAQNPKILKTYLEKIEQDFNYIYTELGETYKKRKKRPILQSLDWKKGIKYIFADIVKTLKKWDVYYRYSSRKSLDKRWYLPENYKKIREEKVLERFVITNDFLSKNQKSKPRKEIVTIPKKYDLFEDDILKIIYKNKVAIIDYNTDQGFIIENPLFANFERKLFKLLFQFLKK
jgi:sugar-specific transcriptional regulator TrmB